MKKLSNTSKKIISEIINKYIHFLKSKKYNNIVRICETIGTIFTDLPDIQINDPPQCFEKNEPILHNNGSIFWLLQKLAKDYPEKIDSEIKKYVTNSNCLKEDKCLEWLDTYGSEKLRKIYYLLDRNKLPTEITQVLRNKLSSRIFSTVYNMFVSIHIQKIIEQQLHYICIYNYVHTQHNIKIKLIFIKDDVKPNYKYAKHIIHYILTLLHFLNITETSIEIKLFLTNEKKKINKQYKCLGVDEVNTGSTYRGDTKSIVIWRKEECKKVILHELCHSLYLDFDIPDSYLNRIKQLFSIPEDTEIRPYETYVETWANILLIAITSEELNKDVNTVLKEEIIYSIYQAAKILHHFGFTCWEEFYKNKEKNYRDYCQKSSILSYYIIKAAIIFNIDDFITFCKNNNEHIMNYNKNNDNIHDRFVELIEKCCDNKEFQNILNNIIKTAHFDSSLRMTCNETSIDS